MYRKLILLALLAVPTFAALPNFTNIWEVESGGSDVNGGCFDSSKAGTDFTQQTAAQQSYTDLVAVTTTTMTSAGRPFTSVDPGNCIHIASGTGWTVGWYEIVSVAGSTATVDRAIATMGSTGGTGLYGGALATVGQCSTNMVLSTGAGCWIKQATYSITAMISLASGATNNGMAFMSGYQTARGDLNFSNCFTATCPIIQGAAGIAGADNALMRFSGTPSGSVFSNFILDCNSQTFTAGLRYSGAFSSARNIWAKNCSDPAFDFENIGMCDRCTSTNSPAAGITGGHPAVSALYNANFNIHLYNVALLGSTVNGTIALNGGCGGDYENVVVAHFTGTTSQAHQCLTLEGDGGNFLNWAIDDITADAFQFQEANNIDTRSVMIRNAVISNVGTCFHQSGTLTFRAQSFLSDHNFCNTVTSTFYNGWPAGTGDVALSVNPFNSPSTNDFSLNTAATGGALVKGAGFPGTVSAGVGHLDGGAIQSSTAAPPANTVGFPLQ